MAKKRQTPQKRTRTRGHLRAVPPVSDRSEDQPLIQAFRRALREPSPAVMLMAIGGILEAADAHDDLDDGAPTRFDTLVESFLDIDLRETTAALHIIAALVPDDLLRVQLRRELGRRRQPMPDWVTALSSVEVRRAALLTHVLDDGHDVVLDVALGGDTFLVTVYIDFNIGTVVKDAFPAVASFEEYLAYIEEAAEPDSRLVEIELGDAAARIRTALRNGRLMGAEHQTDTWPQLRPVVEWLARSMPEGEAAYDFRDISAAERTALAERFLASPHGAGFDGAEHHALLDNLLDFATTTGTRDPLRWTAVNVEVALDQWLPANVDAEPESAVLLPDLLRALIRFAHAERGIGARWTKETLESVDRWEPSYRAQIAADGRVPPAVRALLAAQGTPIDDWTSDLERAVGGADALSDLDEAPLPREPFDWEGIPGTITAKLREIDGLLAGHAEELLDDEHLTAERRLLRQVALADPGLFAPRTSAKVAARAVVWLVAKANDTTSYYGPLTMQELLEPLGGTSAGDRARTYLRALGLDDSSGDVHLGSPSYLVSVRRAELIEERDAWS